MLNCSLLFPRQERYGIATFHPYSTTIFFLLLTHFPPLQWISNMIGLFVFVSGVERTTSAASCDKGVVSNSRRFGDQTVVADNAYKADLKQNYRK